MLKSLLIANRGEIACRIIRTARRLGVRTVAVYSDADARALHVRAADEAVHIGPSPARESYLVGEKIIAAAKATGAEAIHPGYGFLSENAAFAQAVIDAGLIWVGPRPASITAMGLKDAAKKLMAAAGVPVTPGYLGEDQDPKRLKQEAEAIGWPVLIKAVAGGGGKGMRRVNDAAEFDEMLQSCKREAASSFGDDRVLLEKYIERPRHIEVQVFGDTHGNVVHLFERDCSLQRRHQKVIEEAPAPGMDEVTRAAVCEAAVKAAKAVDYVGAGTIEFIADASEGLRADRIWFMEMNTRLQVEHPVTEEITGVDLVEWQLRVASGEALPLKQEELSIDGWAMEARLYAEDPSKGFLPSIGTLSVFTLCGDTRVDTGVEEGATISPYYDPMIAKVIVHADERQQALEMLAGELEFSVVWPVKTNIAFLVRLLRDPDVQAGDLDTGLIARRGDAILQDPGPTARDLSDAATWFARQSTKFSPMAAPLFGFRLNREPERWLALDVNGERTTFDYQPTTVGAYECGFQETGSPSEQLMLKGGARYLVSISRTTGGSGSAASDGAIVSPMPGKIIALAIAKGEAVTKGQKLLTLEAMKMEHSLASPFDGIVAELNAEEGAQVSEGALLARIEKGEWE
ncbi:MAG: acetyl/propionyl/methylcrotonyl-CoA carboxylase subunit alpha [Sphingosinicella sp.]|uniref:acetyl/propionyl/methylcrotonyl-CoA carboxylase subunit alpha n=1 Tax=Sphingosinicella sp. TaxID=1917971 RepID=UPI00403771AE